MRAMVPQHMEVCLAITGTDGLVGRTGAGQHQEALPTSGVIWLANGGLRQRDHDDCPNSESDTSVLADRSVPSLRR